jgi:DNA-directed RNA polymerase subunit RPC12/RpoP
MPEIFDKMIVTCPHCTHKLSLSIQFLRQNPIIKCPKCKKEMQINSDLDKKLKSEENRIDKMLKQTTIKFKL